MRVKSSPYRAHGRKPERNGKMNTCTFIGNITKDLDLRKTQSGKSVVEFTVAVDSRTGKSERTDFPRFTAWGKLAEIAAQYVGKGRKVGVVAAVRTTSYADKDGVVQYQTKFVASEIDFLDRKEQPAKAVADADSEEAEA